MPLDLHIIVQCFFVCTSTDTEGKWGWGCARVGAGVRLRCGRDWWVTVGTMVYCCPLRLKSLWMKPCLGPGPITSTSFIQHHRIGSVILRSSIVGRAVDNPTDPTHHCVSDGWLVLIDILNPAWIISKDWSWILHHHVRSLCNCDVILLELLWNIHWILSDRGKSDQTNTAVHG